MTGTNDAGTITLSHVQAQVGTPIKATLKDQDDISTFVTWQWYRDEISVDDSNEADGPGATTDTYTPQGGDTTATPVIPSDALQPLVVRAMYTDGGGNAETVTFPTATDVRANGVAVDDPLTLLIDDSGLNTPPKFYKDGVDPSDVANRGAEDEVTSYIRYVLENQQMRNVRTSDVDARVYDTANANYDANNVAATVNVFDGFFAAVGHIPTPEDPGRY